MQPDLIALDDKKPATPLEMDNFITEIFVNQGMKPKRSKTLDTKWKWLRDKEILEQIRVYQDRGTNKDTDYCTKRHPPIHHR